MGQRNFTSGVVRLEPGTTKNREGREFPFSVLKPLAELLETQRDSTKELERKKECIIPTVFHRNGKPIGSYAKSWETPAGKPVSRGDWSMISDGQPFETLNAQGCHGPSQ